MDTTFISARHRHRHRHTRHYRPLLLSSPPSVGSTTDQCSFDPAVIVANNKKSRKYVSMSFRSSPLPHGDISRFRRCSKRKLALSTAPNSHSFAAWSRRGFSGSVIGGGIHMLLVGGIAVAAKLAALFVARVLCVKAWPYLQAISISTWLLRRLTGKSKIPLLAEVAIAPLHSLAAPVFCLTIAQPVMRYMMTKLQAKNKSMGERNKAWAKRHEWGGEKVYQLIVDMSGFYVKSAQILASKADFVPEAWTKYLCKLLDNAPSRPFPEVECCIKEQLANSPYGSSFSEIKKQHVPLDAVFLEVERIPLASASIAQVHGGVLKDGTRIVVKVQHLGMEMMMRSDLRNIAWLAKLLQGQLPVDLVPIVKEIQSTIPLEFNFEREVWFMIAIRKSLEDNGFKEIVCPLPFTQFCSNRLIVMQRLDGVPFTRILHSEAADFCSRKSEVIQAVEHLLRAYGQMLLVDGVFHADPHAGNLLLLSDGRLGLLDYGQSKVIDEEMRQKLARLVLALSEDDDLAIALALLDIGVVFQPVDAMNVPLHTIAIAARILFDVCYVEEATVSPMSQNSILRTIPLKSFNHSVWMVVRANLLLRGLCFSLNLNVSAAKLWRPYALTALQPCDKITEEFSV